MKRNLKFLIISLYLILVSSFTVAQNKSMAAQDFTLTDTDGITVNLFDTLSTNQTVLLFFFSCDCVHCYTASEIADSIYRQFGSGTEHLTVWGIGSDFYDMEEIQDFKDSTNVSFKCLSTFHDDNVFDMYDINYTPQFIAICDNTASESIPQNMIIETLDHCFPTSIEEQKKDFQNYRLENNLLTIENIENISNISVYDITGRLLFKGNYLKNKNIIPFTKLGNIYILKVIFIDGHSDFFKIISL